MQDVIFREYDIRGKVGSELSIDKVYDLARAIAYYFVQHNPRVKTVAVGMDGRTHSPLIKDELIRGLTDSGLDVIFVGLCPSPALYFALYTLPVEAGLMVTASHNPADYNGIKICLGKKSVWGSQVNELLRLYKQRSFLQSTQKGSITEKPIIQTYISWLADHFASLKNIPINAVIDCGNGAGGAVVPLLVEAMGWANVTVLYPEVDGTYPNHEADPVKEKNMADVKKVLGTTQATVGIGLDGDADRMVAMTKDGFLVPGDQMLAIFSKQLLLEYPGASIVLDIKSSSSLLEMLGVWGGRACLSPSGHAIIKDQMRAHKALLGGELSCHFFFNDRYFGYDDGIYAMLRLFELIQQSGKSLEQLVREFPKKWSSPEFRLPCDENKKDAVVQAVKSYFLCVPNSQMITIDGVRVTLPYGWGIVRASNTQAELCVRFESDSCDGLRRIRQDFIAALQPYLSSDVLSDLCVIEHA